MKNWSIQQGCVACEKVTENGSVLHHLMSRKAHPEHQLKTWNLLPLCSFCHTEIHARGTTHMSAKYQGVLRWLEANNWIFDSFQNKWRHEGANLS